MSVLFARAEETERYTKVANELKDLINARDYAGIEAKFNTEMATALPLDKSSAFFKRMTLQTGRFKQLGQPKSGGGAMVYPVTCDRGMLDMRLALDGSGHIAGLSFQPRTAAKARSTQDAQTARYRKAVSQIKGMINAGDYAGIEAKFNKDMNAALPLDKSSALFKRITQDAGKIQGFGSPQADGEWMVFPVQFEKKMGDMRLALDDQDLIAGIAFIPHGAAGSASAKP